MKTNPMLTDPIHLQPGYAGREIIAAYQVADCIRMGKGEASFLHIGSVKWIESIIGQRTPDFYPSWAADHLYRKMERGTKFIKSATSYKRWESICEDIWVSDQVKFVDEWRHYVADGVDLCSWWYQGNDITSEEDPHGPPLPFDIPPGFCGAIDIGILETGEVALVEVQHPYAIGWYGEMADARTYLHFLHSGWKFLQQK